MFADESLACITVLHFSVASSDSEVNEQSTGWDLSMKLWRKL
ncbi:hypothetical protein Hanom_Chr03g00253371 [Helianthus anomalus]